MQNELMHQDDLFSRADDAIAESLKLRAERQTLESKGALVRTDLLLRVWAAASERVESDAFRQNARGTSPPRRR